MKKELNIRFLRQGLIKINVDEKILTNKEKLLNLCQEYLESIDDEVLMTSMSDFDDVKNNGYFDSAPEVAAIEDPNKDYELLFSTPEWDSFNDSELNPINKLKTSDLLISKSDVPFEVYSKLKLSKNSIVYREGTNDEYIKFITINSSDLKLNKY